MGGVQGGAPRRYPRRTRRNSGKHLRKRKATSNIQRDAKRRRDQLLTGGCKEQTQDQQKESPGKEVCENRWPCKGMSSPSLERILAGKGPRSPQPGRPPKAVGLPLRWPQATARQTPGEASSSSHQDKDPRESAPLIDPSPKDYRSQNLLPLTAPKHWLAEPSGKLLLRHLSASASQGQGQGDLQNKEEAKSPGKW